MSKAVRMSSTYLKQNLGLLRLYSLSHLDSLKFMNMLGRTRAEGEPKLLLQFDYPTYCLKIKSFCDVAERKSFLSFFLVTFRLGL